MSETPATDELKARIKKLGFEASQLKLDLHDLSEELPNGWEQIMQVAETDVQEICRAGRGTAAVGGDGKVRGRLSQHKHWQAFRGLSSAYRAVALAAGLIRSSSSCDIAVNS